MICLKIGKSADRNFGEQDIIFPRTPAPYLSGLGDLLDLLAALAPCVMSYAEIGFWDMGLAPPG